VTPVPHNFASVPAAQGLRIDRKPGFIDARFNSDPTHLAGARSAIESLCFEAGFDAKTTGEIGLTINEAIANIIRHAYGGASDMPIELRAQVKDGVIEITLRDWGNGQCPASPGKRESDDPLTPGGLGLVCMNRLMDDVLFTPQPRGMLLTMHRAKAR
jgi:anti-sigma regulatory factor (Ser/Thr protein kinase)